MGFRNDELLRNINLALQHSLDALRTTAGQSQTEINALHRITQQIQQENQALSAIVSQGQKDSKALKALTMIAMLYLPASLVAVSTCPQSLFSHLTSDRTSLVHL